MDAREQDAERGAATDRYDWSAVPSGARGAFTLAGFVMACSFLGFGAFIHSLGFSLEAGLLTNLLIWALPGQVVFVAGWTAGNGILVTGLAVSLTAVRLMPMCMLVLSAARLERAPRWPEFLVAHFIAITMWVIANQGLHAIERPRRLPWLIGLGLALMTGMSGFTVIGYYLADGLPQTLAAALVFFTPTFFLLSLFGAARYRFDYLAIVFGAAIGPLTALYAPKLDLLAGGIVGGILAYALGRPRRKKPL
ncbi:MAG: AzlC family ABC transporter permease [Parvibaculaceae bacterium]